MASTFDLFAQGYGSTEVTLAPPLEFPVDRGYGRKVPSLDRQFLSRVHRYIGAIRAGCRIQLAHLEDVTRVHSQWQYTESHQLLKAIASHLQRPFQQAMDMIRVKVIDGGLKQQQNGMFHFPSVDVDERLWLDYHDAIQMMANLSDHLSRCERIATLNGYKPLQLPFQVDLACFAPCQSPLELFAEILRRSSKHYLDQGASAYEVVKFVEKAPERLKLRSCGFRKDEDWGISGRPRVMTWTLGPAYGSSTVNKTAIRTTKPSWESFKPLFEVTAELRRCRIQNHTMKIARI